MLQKLDPPCCVLTSLVGEVRNEQDDTKRVRDRLEVADLGLIRSRVFSKRNDIHRRQRRVLILRQARPLSSTGYATLKGRTSSAKSADDRIEIHITPGLMELESASYMSRSNCRRFSVAASTMKFLRGAATFLPDRAL